MPRLAVDVVSFARQVERFRARVELNSILVVKRVSLDLFRRIVIKTPVDTGRARASWRISAGQPDTSVEPPRARGGLDAAPPRAPGLGALGGGLATIYITNNLPYIVELENGSSNQAPLGMVRVSIEEVSRFLGGVTGG